MGGGCGGVCKNEGGVLKMQSHFNALLGVFSYLRVWYMKLYYSVIENVGQRIWFKCF